MDNDSVTAVNCAEVAVFYGDGEVLAQNTLAFEHLSGAISSPELRDLAVMVHDWHKTYVMPLITNECTSTEAIALNLTTFPNPVRSSFPSPQVSGGAGQGLPMVCCLRLDFVTDVPYPAGVGKNFISGLPRSVVMLSHITAGFAVDMMSAYEQLAGIASFNGWRWVVLSKSVGGVLRDTAVISPVMSVSVPDLRVRVYRQRIARFGT